MEMKRARMRWVKKPKALFMVQRNDSDMIRLL